MNDLKLAMAVVLDTVFTPVDLGFKRSVLRVKVRVGVWVCV